MPRPTFESLHPLDRQIRADEEIGRWFDKMRELRDRDGAVTPEHREKYRCGGCWLSLGFGPAHGIDRKAYHPGCFEVELKTRLKGETQ